MSIKSAILDAIAPDDGTGEKEVKPSPTQPGQVAFVPPPGTPIYAQVLPVNMSDSKVYQGMCAKTQLTNCTNLQKYLQMKQNLSVIADIPTRNKAALAASQVTVESILVEIKSMHDALNAEIIRARNVVTDAKINTVNKSQAVALSLEREIADKQSQLNSIKAGIQEAADKVKANEDAIASAGARRNKDLDDLEIEFRSLGG